VKLRIFAVLAIFLVIPALALRAQDAPVDDATAKATRILLDKAEEEYRTYFKRPETTFQLWAAIKFEIDVGKFDLAALHLKRLLNNDKVKAEQVDEDLFKIETVEGMASFLRLVRVQRWSDVPSMQKEAADNVKVFFERLSAIVEKKLSDPERITKFIRQLDAGTPEERMFAFKELNRSRERAIPLVVDKLRESVGRPLFHRIVEALVNFDKETVPAYLEVFKARDEKDAADPELRLTLMRIVRVRGDKRILPYLWHLSAAKMYPPSIRDLAKQMLGEILEVDPSVMPPAKLALADLSMKYFKHQVSLPARLRFWKWDGVHISNEPIELIPSAAEELFGTRYALEALDLDPGYVPAQYAFLDMTLERTILQDFDKAVLQPLPPATQRLLATVDADLLLRLMDKAYEDANIPILLGTLRALGDRREARAAKATGFGTPQGIVRGLYFPDRRVQFAAVNALLKMPTSPTPVAASRVVDVLNRLVTIDQPPAALILGASGDKAAEVTQAMKDAGLTPIQGKTPNEGLAKVRTIGNIEAIVLHYGMSSREVNYALNQIAADTDFGRTPVLLVAPADKMVEYRRLAAKFPRVRVVSEAVLPSVDETKKILDELTVAAGVAKLSPEERKLIAAESLDEIRQMSKNQIAGYDVRPTFDNVALSIRTPDLAPIAIEALGTMPGSGPQIRLAGVVLDPTKEKLRTTAARELNRHVQYNGLLMPQEQFRKLVAMYATEVDVGLKTELAYLIGSFRSTRARDGAVMTNFRPDAPAAPMPPAPKAE
jgi:hypothetical protein